MQHKGLRIILASLALLGPIAIPLFFLEHRGFGYWPGGYSYNQYL